MWDIIDQWLVLSFLAWAIFTIWQKVFRSYKLSCQNPCGKKDLFKPQKNLVLLGNKLKK